MCISGAIDADPPEIGWARLRSDWVVELWTGEDDIERIVGE